MNKLQFEDFKTRLHSHHKLHVNNECTADPIYLVQKQVIDWGYVEEYASYHQLYCSCDEIGYDSVEEFFDNLEDAEIEYMIDQSDYTIKSFKDDMDTLENLEEYFNNHPKYMYNGWQLLHGNSRYETGEIFLTHIAAEDFLKAKGWKLGDDGGGRIYVDSLCRSNEFREVIDLIVDGKLEFKEEGL